MNNKIKKLKKLISGKIHNKSKNNRERERKKKRPQEKKKKPPRDLNPDRSLRSPTRQPLDYSAFGSESQE